MARRGLRPAAVLLVTLLPAVLATLASNSLRHHGGAHSSPWTWRCNSTQQLCVKHALVEREVPEALSACKMTCSVDANLWPRPQTVDVRDPRPRTVNVNSMSIEFQAEGGEALDYQRSAGGLLEKVADRFREGLEAKTTTKDGSTTVKDGGNGILVRVILKDPSVSELALDLDEGYELHIGSMAGNDPMVNVTVRAANVFGARHALETLGQLMVRDELRRELVMPSAARIVDFPAYTYRGILLDTARSFVSVAAIKRTLNAMAASKLNTFHWHITDSHSFPLVSPTYPKFSQYGAFSPDEVYTPEDIRDLVEYARVRGIRVLPELDAPAHVGEGWQWVGDGATVCFRAEPWQKYCVEPPCGQLDPTVDKVYDVLKGLYSDMLALFKPDMFHMGGDEVNFNCWNSTSSIVQWMAKRNLAKRGEDDFRMVWDHFQKRALRNLVEANNGKELPVVLWTSGLTAPGKVDRYLDPAKYIIQIWTKGDDALIKELADKGYRLIFSNYDALYFDCGFGAWVGEGNNWCSPYIGWQKVYDNDPRALLRRLGVAENRLGAALGAEATLWTEQADSHTVDGRLWPRAAAMAERLWLNREDWTWKQAEHRMLEQRQRLVALGVQADRLEPQWCDQNPGLCYLSKDVVGEH